MPASSRDFFLTFLLGCSCGVLITVVYHEFNLCIGPSCATSLDTHSDSPPLNDEPIVGQIDQSQSLFTGVGKGHVAMPPVVYNESLGRSWLYNPLFYRVLPTQNCGWEPKFQKNSLCGGTGFFRFFLC